MDMDVTAEYEAQMDTMKTIMNDCNIDLATEQTAAEGLKNDMEREIAAAETAINRISETFEGNMANVDRRIQEFDAEMQRLLSEDGILDVETAIEKFNAKITEIERETQGFVENFELEMRNELQKIDGMDVTEIVPEGTVEAATE
jgi:hypothetical protein